MDTERLYAQVDEAAAEMQRIEREGIELQRGVDALLSDFAMKYPHADTGSLSRDFAARLADTVDDLQGPAYRRKSRIEDTIGNIEERDLMRSSPLVL